MFFVRHVQWGTIFFNWSQHFNGTFLKMIYFQCVLSGMFDNGIFSSTDHNISMEPCSKWFISNVFCPACSTMEYSLQLITTFQWNLAQNDLFPMCFVRHVRQWNILCNSTQYFNKTLVKMIHFQCLLRRMFDNKIFSATQLNTSIKP